MSFKWQTHKAGSLSSSISKSPGVAGGRIMTRQEQHRLSWEFKDCIRSHTKIDFVFYRFLSLLITITVDQMLAAAGYLVQNAPPQMVAGMSINLQLAQVLPVAPIPNNTDHLPLILLPGQPLRPTEPNCVRYILQRVTRALPIGNNNIDILFRFFRTHCLMDAQGVQQIDMADVWTNPRGRSWTHYYGMQSKEAATNQTTFFQANIAIGIKKVIRFEMNRVAMQLQQVDPNLNLQARKAVIARTTAFFNPKHIFHFPWNAQHPLFAAGVNMNAAAVAIWVNALAPFYPLLRFILDNNNADVLPLFNAVPAAAFPNNQSIYRDAREYTFFRMCTGAQGRKLGERALPFLRLAGLVLGQNIMHANDDEERQGPAAAKPILLCPLPSRHTVKFLYFDYRMLLELIVRPSWRQWQKRRHVDPGIRPACFHIPDPLNNNVLVLPVIPPQGPPDVAMRNLCAVMFSNVLGPTAAAGLLHPNGQPARRPFRQRNRYADGPHQWRQYGHQLPGEPARPLTLPIEKMGISTDGASLNIPFTTKVQRAGPNDPFADYQNRRVIPLPSERKKIPKHKRLPAPSTPHPGTKQVGFLTTTSACYVMNNTILINPQPGPQNGATVDILSTDFGQVIHSYTVDTDIIQLIRRAVQDEQAGVPPPGGFASHRDALVAAIKAHTTIITGAHTSKQTLTHAHRQSLEQRKRNNEAEALARNVGHLSVFSREQRLRGYRHRLQGATIATLCHSHRREFYHFKALFDFYNHSYIAGRHRLSHTIATDSRNMRAAHQINGYQHPVQVNRGQTLTGGVKLTMKINKPHAQRRAERYRAKRMADRLVATGDFRRRDPNNPPLHYVDTSQGNRWAPGTEAQSNKVMANAISYSGAGVIEQWSKNTSQINPLLHPHMADQPGEMVPPRPAGGFPHERVVHLQQMQFDCPIAVHPNHIPTNRKRVRRGGANGDHRKRLYHIAVPNAAFPVNAGFIPFFDPLNPIPHAVPKNQNRWKNIFRLEASINPAPFSTAAGQPIPMPPSFLAGTLRLRLTAAQNQAGAQAYAVMPHDMVGCCNIRQAGTEGMAYNQVPNWNKVNQNVANPQRVANWHPQLLTSAWNGPNLRMMVEG